MTDIIGDIAAATQEQSSGVDQVNRAITQMDQVVQSNAAQTEELSSTAEVLAGQARALQALIVRFKLDQGADTARSAGVAALPRAAPGRVASASTAIAPVKRALVGAGARQGEAF